MHTKYRGLHTPCIQIYYSRRIDLPNANAKYLSRQFRYVVSTVLDDAGVNLFPDSSVALRFLM